MKFLENPWPQTGSVLTEKPGSLKIAEDLNAVIDSLTACKFIFFAAGIEEYALAL